MKLPPIPNIKELSKDCAHRTKPFLLGCPCAYCHRCLTFLDVQGCPKGHAKGFWVPPSFAKENPDGSIEPFMQMPVRRNIILERLSEKEMRLIYEETQPDLGVITDLLLTRTEDMMSELGLPIERSGNTLRYEKKGLPDTLTGAMIVELLPESDLGKTSLSALMFDAMVYQVIKKKMGLQGQGFREAGGQ